MIFGIISWRCLWESR